MNTFTHAHALFIQDAPRAYADLKPRQQTFVRMLHEAGATGDTVRRQVVKSTHASDTDFPWPSWLTGDKTRRCNRGVFYIPELAEYIANIVEDDLIDEDPTVQGTLGTVTASELVGASS